MFLSFLPPNVGEGRKRKVIKKEEEGEKKQRCSIRIHPPSIVSVSLVLLRRSKEIVVFVA